MTERTTAQELRRYEWAGLADYLAGDNSRRGLATEAVRRLYRDSFDLDPEDPGIFGKGGLLEKIAREGIKGTPEGRSVLEIYSKKYKESYLNGRVREIAEYLNIKEQEGVGKKLREALNKTSDLTIESVRNELNNLRERADSNEGSLDEHGKKRYNSLQSVILAIETAKRARLENLYQDLLKKYQKATYEGIERNLGQES